MESDRKKIAKIEKYLLAYKRFYMSNDPCRTLFTLHDQFPAWLCFQVAIRAFSLELLQLFSLTAHHLHLQCFASCTGCHSRTHQNTSGQVIVRWIIWIAITIGQFCPTHVSPTFFLDGLWFTASAHFQPTYFFKNISSSLYMTTSAYSFFLQAIIGRKLARINEYLAADSRYWISSSNAPCSSFFRNR